MAIILLQRAPLEGNDLRLDLRGNYLCKISRSHVLVCQENRPRDVAAHGHRTALFVAIEKHFPPPSIERLVENCWQASFRTEWTRVRLLTEGSERGNKHEILKKKKNTVLKEKWFCIALPFKANYDR